MFKFHFGRGDTISIVADNQRDAVKKFQHLLPGVVFITETEWQKRKTREQERLIRIACEAEVAKRGLVGHVAGIH